MENLENNIENVDTGSIVYVAFREGGVVIGLLLAQGELIKDGDVKSFYQIFIGGDRKFEIYGDEIAYLSEFTQYVDRMCDDPQEEKADGLTAIDNYYKKHPDKEWSNGIR